MTKDDMIKRISAYSGTYRNLLIDMMNYYDVISLRQLTEEQVAEYYYKLEEAYK
jgi:hypothetical protein